MNLLLSEVFLGRAERVVACGGLSVVDDEWRARPAAADDPLGPVLDGPALAALSKKVRDGLGLHP